MVSHFFVTADVTPNKTQNKRLKVAFSSMFLKRKKSQRFGASSSSGVNQWRNLECNCCVPFCAENLRDVFCRVLTKLSQAAWSSSDLLWPSVHISPPQPGLFLSAGPEFLEKASFSNKFSRYLPTKKLCNHFFHKITTPPRSSPVANPRASPYY